MRGHVSIYMTNALLKYPSQTKNDHTDPVIGVVDLPVLANGCDCADCGAALTLLGNARGAAEFGNLSQIQHVVRAEHQAS